MSIEELYIPSRKGYKHIRNLNLGVRHDIDSTELPDGSFLEVDGYMVRVFGLQRRPTVVQYGQWNIDFPPIRGIWTVRTVTGNSFTLLLDSKKIYLITSSNVTAYDWTYSTGTVTTTSGSKDITGLGTGWATVTTWLRPGDRVWINGNNTVGDLEYNSDGVAIRTIPIVGITSNSELSLSEELDDTLEGATYKIYRTIPGESKIVPVAVNDSVYLADGFRPLQKITSSTWGLGSDSLLCPATVTYFGDRLWMGNLYDPTGETGQQDNHYSQMIIWSGLGIGNLEKFEPSENFLNLPYGFGDLRLLKPMSQFLVAYFNDSIWMGQRSNLTGLPVEFTKFETGGLGISTPYAVSDFLDGHFFLGQDGVRFLSQRGIENVSVPVARDITYSISDWQSIRAATDYSTTSIIFGICTSGSTLDEIWRFNWESKAWSKEGRNTDFLMTDTILETLTWDTLETVLSGDTWDDGWDNYASWEGIQSGSEWNQQLYFNIGGKLYYYSDIGGHHTGGVVDADNSLSPYTRITTGDMTLDNPDLNKIFTEFVVELSAPVPDDEDSLVFTLEGSVDKGEKWKALGTLNIKPGHIDGAKAFRLFGPHGRFRLTGSRTEEHLGYIISGIGIRYKMLGDQTQGRV